MGLPFLSESVPRHLFPDFEWEGLEAPWVDRLVSKWFPHSWEDGICFKNLCPSWLEDLKSDKWNIPDQLIVLHKLL